jgi:hypothetical protein
MPGSRQEILLMKVFVGNLAPHVTDAQLNDLGTPYGTILSASVAVDQNSGTSNGFGFLEFDSEEAARSAIRGLEGRNVQGQMLKVLRTHNEGHGWIVMVEGAVRIDESDGEEQIEVVVRGDRDAIVFRTTATADAIPSDSAESALEAEAREALLPPTDRP